MKDLLIPIAILAGWFVLNAWVLPTHSRMSAE